MRISYVDGSSADTPRALPADRIAFERKYQHRLGSQEILEEHVLFIAWTSLHRVSLAPDDFDEWLPTVEDWNDDDEADAADPTVPLQAASTGSSPDSQ